MNINAEVAVLVRVTRDRKRACEDRDEWCYHKLQEAGKTILRGLQRKHTPWHWTADIRIERKGVSVVETPSLPPSLWQRPWETDCLKQLNLQPWPGTTVSTRVGEKYCLQCQMLTYFYLWWKLLRLNRYSKCDGQHHTPCVHNGYFLRSILIKHMQIRGIEGLNVRVWFKLAPDNIASDILLGLIINFILKKKETYRIEVRVTPAGSTMALNSFWGGSRHESVNKPSVA